MTINEIQNDIIKEMASLEDWFDTYEFIIQQGRLIQPVDNNIKSESNRIHGCQSNVWISSYIENGRILFEGESDSQITQGILFLLFRVLNNQLPDDVKNADLYFIKEIGLSTNLSPSRANGLSLIIRHIKQCA